MLLVTDMDDTLIPGLHSPGATDGATARLRDVFAAAREAGMRVAIAINTGRTLPLLEEALTSKAHCLPPVDVLVAGVGTRIYYAAGEGGAEWVEDAEWTASLNAGGWSCRAATAVVDAAIAEFGGDRVQWQREVERHEHKLTFLYHSDLRQEMAARMAEGLAAAGIAATIVDGPAGRGPKWRFVDLLPRAAGKGAAMERVRQQLGFSCDETVACGDAENDLLMLQQAWLAICVGNSQPSVQAWAREAQARDGGGGGPRRVYLARPESEAADGVLEGLRALGFAD